MKNYPVLCSCRQVSLNLGLLIITALPGLLSSCDNDPLDIVGTGISASNGVFILNEGNFNQDNATLSFYDYTEEELFNEVFFAANGVPLGDVAQSMTIHNKIAYVVLNNSGKIYIFDPVSMKYIDKISGLASPRFIYFADNLKAYISDMHSKSIYVYNAEQQEITKEINLNNYNSFNQHSTEQMVGIGDFVFVTCWSYDNKVLVIDRATDLLVDSIEVGKQPNSIQLDQNNKIWVLSDGGFAGSAFGQELASLSRIDPYSREVEAEFQFRDMNSSPTNLYLNGSMDTLYYIDGGVYRMPVMEKSLPETPLIKAYDHTYYSMAVDPDRHIIYLGDAVDYQQNGWIYRFTPSGAAIDSFRVGINPGYIYFW